MDLPLSDFRNMAVAEFDTTKLLAHAAQQAQERGYKNFPIVDVDSHHYESEAIDEILDYMDDPVIQQLARSSRQASAKGGGALSIGGVGYQDMGGRVMRYAHARHGKDGSRPAARHGADAALDGRHRHRHRGDVSDADAAAWPASAGRSRGGAGARL